MYAERRQVASGSLCPKMAPSLLLSFYTLMSIPRQIVLPSSLPVKSSSIIITTWRKKQPEEYRYVE